MEFRPDNFPTAVNPEGALWQLAFDCSERLTAMRAGLAADFVRLSAVDTSRLGIGKPQEDHAAQTAAYWQKDGERKELEAHEQGLLDTLERLAVGEATDEEVAAYLPPVPKEDSPAPVASNRVDWWETYLEHPDAGLTLGDVLGIAVEPSKEEGRLTTGRNARKVVFNGGIDPSQAHDEFHHRTADTHGGKVGHGKNGNRYLTSSGKRVRKY